MSAVDDPTADSNSDSTGPGEPEWKRKRRLAAVFGDVLPEQSSDDRDDSAGSAGKGDGWYRDQVPPHHG